MALGGELRPPVMLVISLLIISQVKLFTGQSHQLPTISTALLPPGFHSCFATFLSSSRLSSEILSYKSVLKIEWNNQRNAFRMVSDPQRTVHSHCIRWHTEWSQQPHTHWPRVLYSTSHILSLGFWFLRCFPYILRVV